MRYIKLPSRRNGHKLSLLPRSNKLSPTNQHVQAGKLPYLLHFYFIFFLYIKNLSNYNLSKFVYKFFSLITITRRSNGTNGVFACLSTITSFVNLTYRLTIDENANTVKYTRHRYPNRIIVDRFSEM